MMPRLSMPKYQVTIGLEVHAQLTTRSKMFCGCAVQFGAQPNTNTCPTCLGLPGALPVLNEAAIEKTILTGMMLGCETPPLVKWDRKNYFYPDMPKNYQITQFDLPLCLGGGVPLYDLAYPKDAQKTIAKPGKVVRLTRIHLEEDVAKSTHHERFSTIDFNRAGTPLMEIVSEPDIDSAEEAFAYLNSLRQILIYGGVSDADMEKGNLRCDVNISVREVGAEKLGAKVELKNLNSVSAVRRAIHFESARQIQCLERGESIQQSTRRWDDDRGETTLMRSKEDAHDYRYFPDPDLVPLHTAELVERVRGSVPELPHQKRARFEKDYGCSSYDASVLASSRELADYFETAIAAAAKASPKKVANWILNELLALEKRTDDLDAEQSQQTSFSVSAQALAQLVELVEAGSISGAQGKEVLAAMAAGEGNAADIIRARGFEQVSDSGALEAIVNDIIAANPDRVAEVQGGNPKALNWFTGQAMKASGGKANAKMVTELVRQKILPDSAG